MREKKKNEGMLIALTYTVVYTVFSVTPEYKSQWVN